MEVSISSPSFPHLCKFTPHRVWPASSQTLCSPYVAWHLSNSQHSWTFSPTNIAGVLLSLYFILFYFSNSFSVALEKEMATHSSILAWRIPRREELGRLQSTGLQRVGHGWATSLLLCCIRKNFACFLNPRSLSKILCPLPSIYHWWSYSLPSSNDLHMSLALYLQSRSFSGAPV